MAGNLIIALADLQEQEALDITRQRLDSNEDPNAILADARRGMAIVGERFSKSEYFIPDLIYSGEILKEVSDLVKPVLLQSSIQENKINKIVLGTVAGDIHDIGLNIVEFMLDTNGFEVFNLGVDVPPQKFVEKTRETGAPIVALSGFLTLAFDSMKDTIKAMETAGLRNQVKIMIGGGQIDEQVKYYTGADAWGRDAMEAVNLAKNWTAGAK
jgi:trimethylamine corrinoid protein